MGEQTKPSSTKRRRRQRNFQNKVQWGIKDGKLNSRLPKLKGLRNLIPEDDLRAFQSHINAVIANTQRRVAPYYLQWTGAFIAIIIMILGAVAISKDSASAGVVLFLLGLLLGGLGFWYRGQLIRRSWKKIAQELKQYFKECRGKYAGVGFEFHQQGHQSTTVRGGKSKGKKEQAMSMWYSRYIVIYLPGDQSLWAEKYQEDKRSIDKIVANNSRAVETYKEYVEDEEPVVLPYWWALARARDGKMYYINNLKQTTQWAPPTLEQIEMEKEELQEVLAPPDVDESIPDSDFDIDAELEGMDNGVANETETTVTDEDRNAGNKTKNTSGGQVVTDDVEVDKISPRNVKADPTNGGRGQRNNRSNNSVQRDYDIGKSSNRRSTSKSNRRSNRPTGGNRKDSGYRKARSQSRGRNQTDSGRGRNSSKRQADNGSKIRNSKNRRSNSSRRAKDNNRSSDYIE